MKSLKDALMIIIDELGHPDSFEGWPESEKEEYLAALERTKTKIKGGDI